MARLTRMDYEHLLSAVHRLECCRDVDEFPQVALESARNLVSADRIGFEHVAPTVPEMWGIADPPLTYGPRQKKIFCENLASHPLVDHYYRTGDPTAHKLSDFVSREEWHRTTLYRELFRELECESQMACPLTPPDRDFYGLAFYRGKRDFSERDRALLNLLRPHVGQILDNLQALKRTTRRYRLFQEIHEDRGRFVVWVDTRGHVVEASRAAREHLHAFFPDLPASATSLPDVLLRWLADGKKPNRSEICKDRDPFIRNLPFGRLTIRFYPEAIGRKAVRENGLRPGRLLLEVDLTPGMEQCMRQRGLSDREIEILYQLEQGKTNTEIAAALSLSPLTVKKHLENIFNKLDVNSRAGAVGKVRTTKV